MNLNRTDVLIKLKHILSSPLPTSPMDIGNVMSQAADWTTPGVGGGGGMSQNVQVPRCHRVTCRNSFPEHRMIWKTTVRNGRTGTGFHLSGLTYFYRSGLQLPSSNSVLSANVLTTTPRHLLPFPRPSSARQTRLRASARIRLRTRGQRTGQTGVLSAPGWAS